MTHLLKNRKGQGTTEYIVVLAAVVGFALIVFWPMLKSALQGKVTGIATQIAQTGNGN